MKKRKQIYNTHTLHNHSVVYIKETRCPVKLESCLRSLLYDHRYKNNKDFYVCSLTKIKNAFKYCERDIKKCSIDQTGGKIIQTGKKSKTSKMINFKTMIDHIISKNKNHEKNVENKIIKLEKILYNS